MAGIAYSACDNNEEALAYYKKADEKAGRSIVPPCMVDFEIEEGNRHDDKWSVQWNSDSLEADSHYLLGVWLISKGLANKGIFALKKAHNTKFNSWLTASMISLSYLKNHEIRSAEKWADRLGKNNKETINPLLMARLEISKANFNTAEDILKKIQIPDLVKPYWLFLSGFALLNSEEELGETLIYKALLIDKDYSPAHMALASFYTERNRFSAARRIIARADPWLSMSPKYLMTLAEIYHLENRSEEAALLWRKVINMDPRHAPALLKMGFYELKIGKYENSDNFFSRVFSIEGESIKLLNRIYLAYKELGQNSKAIETLESMDRIKPRDSHIQKRILTELEAIDPTEAVDKYLAKTMKKNRLSDEIYLLYLSKAVKAFDEKGPNLVETIIASMVKQKSLNVKIIFRAVSILKHKMDVNKKFNPYPFISLLANKACTISKFTNQRAVSLFVSVHLRMHGAQKTKVALIDIIKKYPKNTKLNEMLKNVRQKIKDAGLPGDRLKK